MLDLDTLNRDQLKAVLTTEGPLLVLAGAGSGKTRVITYRLAHMIQKGVHPRNILCVTFTNKAAFEMRERARNLAGKGVKGTTISTFHALGVKILKLFYEAVGLKKGFTICDAGEQVGTIRRILRDLRIDDKRFDAKRVQALISHCKNASVDAEMYRAQGGRFLPGQASHDPLGDDEEDYRVAAIEAYEKYESAMRLQNVVDFDDLLLLTVKLLEKNEQVRTRLQNRWRYVMIDEYQDTNGAQLSLVRLIAGERRNLCVVGDDDQSIYGWRGADVANILSFEKHFEGAEVVMLQTNYRSTACILEVANFIIAKNTDRYPKRLKPAGDHGKAVKIVAMDDEDVEAEEVANAMLSLIAAGQGPGQMAVLYRSNVQSRPVELALRANQIPYRVVGGMDLFDRKEIKDTMAYLKFLTNEEDEQSLRRIINYPPRGIGDTTLKKIDAWAREEGLSLWQGLLKADLIHGLSVRGVDAVGDFVAMFKEHRKLLGRRKASTIAKKLIEASTIEKAVFGSTDNVTLAGRRVANVREIVRQVERYETRIKAKKNRKALAEGAELEPEQAADELDELDDDMEDLEGASLDGFLRELALGGWQDGSSKEERDDQVVLSTIHASKGLEWPFVFLVGVEEELLPHRRTIEGEGEISEERRLAYVAVTRAKRLLTVSYVRHRNRFGQLVPRERSRFLDDLPEEYVESREGDMKEERTEEEKQAIEDAWRAKIRAQLGIK